MVRHRFSAAKLDARADDGNTVSGEPSADSRARSLSTDDQQTSKRLRRTRGAPSSPTGPNEDEDEEDEEDEDDSEAELLAQVKKLDTRPPPTPARASRRQNVKRVEDSESDELSAEEEVFPSQGARARAERSRTQRAKVAPNVPSQGTRAAKGKGKKARETAPRRRS
jgi:hypothetical protein